MSLEKHRPRRERIPPPSDTTRKQRRVLILELNGVLLKTIEMQHGDVCQIRENLCILLRRVLRFGIIFAKMHLFFLIFLWNGLKCGFGAIVDCKGRIKLLSYAFQTTIKNLQL